MWEFIFSTLAGWIGTAGLVVIACLVVGYFIPQFRIHALAIAGLVVTAATIYAKGNRDAKRKWQEAIDNDVAKGGKARADAERDVDAGRVRGDEWDRDARGM